MEMEGMGMMVAVTPDEGRGDFVQVALLVAVAERDTLGVRVRLVAAETDAEDVAVTDAVSVIVAVPELVSVAEVLPVHVAVTAVDAEALIGAVALAVPVGACDDATLILAEEAADTVQLPLTLGVVVPVLETLAVTEGVTVGEAPELGENDTETEGEAPGLLVTVSDAVPVQLPVAVDVLDTDGENDAVVVVVMVAVPLTELDADTVPLQVLLADGVKVRDGETVTVDDWEAVILTDTMPEGDGVRDAIAVSVPEAENVPLTLALPVAEREGVTVALPVTVAEVDGVPEPDGENDAVVVTVKVDVSVFEAESDGVPEAVDERVADAVIDPVTDADVVPV